MSKKSRAAAKASRNGTDPGAIDRAIDTAAAKALPADITLKVDRQPMRLSATSRVTIRAHTNPSETVVLLRDPEGVWHGVLMPPGTTWELRPGGAAAALWTPPGSVR